GTQRLRLAGGDVIHPQVRSRVRTEVDLAVVQHQRVGLTYRFDDGVVTCGRIEQKQATRGDAATVHNVAGGPHAVDADGRRGDFGRHHEQLTGLLIHDPVLAALDPDQVRALEPTASGFGNEL